VIPVACPLLGEEITAATGILRSGQVVQGRQVAEFEAEFAGLVAGRHCVAVSSRIAALWLSLLALGIGPGDEVIIPSFSFSFAATAGAARRQRCRLTPRTGRPARGSQVPHRRVYAERAQQSDNHHRIGSRADRDFSPPGAPAEQRPAGQAR
jgi:hypothetical protein